MPRKSSDAAKPAPKKAKRVTATEPAQQETSIARPVAQGVWSGSITFGLVTVPVELFSATRRTGVALRMLGPDGTPLARRYICPAESRTLSDDEIERGYEIEEGSFVVVTDEDLEQLAPRRSRDIELTRFVPRNSIDPIYFVTPYIVLPSSEQTKAYRLLAETMEATQRAAIANFVMRGKAYPVALFADRGVLRAETLRFGDEVREPAEMEIVASETVDAGRVAEMKRAIGKREESQLDEHELVDHSSERTLELAREKLARGDGVVKIEAAPQQAAAEAEGEDEDGGQVVDLFALIRKRLREKPAKVPSRAKNTAKRKIA